MAHNELLMISAVLAAGSFCQWFAWRIKIPAILPFLLAIQNNQIVIANADRPLLPQPGWLVISLAPLRKAQSFN